MKKNEIIYANSLDGVAYVKDSKGMSDNIHFFTQVTVNTTDNTTTVEYSVEVFRGREDHYELKTTDYNKAVDKYNEVAEKWNPNREELKETL